MKKTYEEIQEKLKKGKAVVLTAEEMSDYVEKNGTKKAAKEVDVVTTATFGAMCSSGAFLNFGHSDPPAKLQNVLINNVPAYGGIAAVDVYIGATEKSIDGTKYGGSNVIEDLIKGKEIKIQSTGMVSDCYPGSHIKGTFTLKDLNNAILTNPRNAYQNYACATNSSKKKIYTYMGTLLPNFGNITFSSCGALSPLINDPEYRTIGPGTRIFIGGDHGFVAYHGTQHSAQKKTNSGNLFTIGDLKNMSPKYLRAGYFPGYGPSLYVGIGIPIPILDEDMAKFTGIRDEDIETDIVDYSVKSLKRPIIKSVNYKELYSGKVNLDGKEVSAAALTSRRVAREIAEELKKRILKNTFLLSQPAESLPLDTKSNPLRVKND